MNNGMWDSSECSSGCESGWTVYLEQSFLSSKRSHGKLVSQGKQVELVNDEEEEDMSMVSDASSGPPHFQQHDNNGCYYNQEPVECKRKKGKEKFRRTLDVHLDDTASSPVFDLSQNNSTMIHNQTAEMNNNNSIEFSQGYSATHFQGRDNPSSSSSSPSYFQYQLSTGNHQMQQNQWHGGSMMGMRRW